jgi:hypothetical protein
MAERRAKIHGWAGRRPASIPKRARALVDSTGSMD